MEHMIVFEVGEIYSWWQLLFVKADFMLFAIQSNIEVVWFRLMWLEPRSNGYIALWGSHVTE